MQSPFSRSVEMKDGLPVLPGAFPLVGHIPLVYRGLAEGLQKATELGLGPLSRVTTGLGTWMVMSSIFADDRPSGMGDVGGARQRPRRVGRSNRVSAPSPLDSLGRAAMECRGLSARGARCRAQSPENCEDYERVQRITSR